MKVIHLSVEKTENGEELVETITEEDYSATENRHCGICVICPSKFYPECIKECSLGQEHLNEEK